MPEEIEVDTDKLREAIDEEIEKESGSLLRTIALTTALFAAAAAIVSLEAGGTVNEALSLETEAARKQAEASDQWAYYQAERVKSSVSEASRHVYLAAGKPPPDSLADDQKRYADKEKDIQGKAKALEDERDAKAAEAEHLMHRHHQFALSVALLQVAIALGAVAALTRKRPAWVGSVVLGVLGAGLFAYALLRL